MPRSLTTSQINRLGERLRRSRRPAVEDLELLNLVRGDYEPSVIAIAEILRRELRVVANWRLKTTVSIIEKLRRDRTRLSKMQDIAGLRIVRQMSLSAQDRLAERIKLLFPEVEVIDRRADPSYGYRALHLIISHDGIPAELQIRTMSQDSWAQLTESLADSWGRGIRYGDPPLRQRTKVAGLTRAHMVNLVFDLSTMVQQMEERRPVLRTREERRAHRETERRMQRILIQLSERLPGA